MRAKASKGIRKDRTKGDKRVLSAWHGKCFERSCLHGREKSLLELSPERTASIFVDSRIGNHASKWFAIHPLLLVSPAVYAQTNETLESGEQHQSLPLNVSDSAVASFLPTMAIGSDRTIHIAWWEARGNGVVAIVYCSSRDGANWPRP